MTKGHSLLYSAISSEKRKQWAKPTVFNVSADDRNVNSTKHTCS